MNTSPAIEGLLNHVRLKTLEHFEVSDTYVYDETLDFRGRASQFIAREGIFNTEEGQVPKDWIFIIWNRSSILPSNYQNRPMEITASVDDPDGHIDNKTTMRMASIDVEFKVVTNNIDVAEALEEHLFVNTGEFATFEADYGGDIGVMTLSTQPQVQTTFEKEDLKEVGPVMAVGITLNMNYPVFMPMKLAHIIRQINYDEFLENGNNASELIQNIVIN